jgi:hypothetical protein
MPLPGNEVERFATAYSNYINDSGDAFDNIYSKAAITNYMMAKDKLDGDEEKLKRVHTLHGGTSIEMPLEYADETGNFQYFNGLDALTFVPKETITNCRWDWSDFAHTQVLDKKDIIERSGSPAKLENYARTKRKGLFKSLKSKFNTEMLAATPADDLHSIPYIVVKDPTAVATIGAIPQATKSWWRNQTKTSTTDATVTLTQYVRETRNIRNTCAYNAADEGPDLYLTDQYVFEYIQEYQERRGTHQFVQTQIAKLMQMEEVPYWKGMNVLWDTGVPNMNGSGSYSSAFLLNTDYLYFVAEESRNFDVSTQIDMMKAKFQDAIGFVVLTRGQLCCTNRNKQGLHFKINQSIVTL